MRNLILRYCALSLALLLLASGAAQAAGRERLSLDRGWLFHLGDVVRAPIIAQEETYGNAKAGNAGGAAASNFDDTGWRALDLPHDWAVEGPFDPNANVSQGYRPRGIGWYRRYLRIDPSERGKHFELQFDAIATHATIWVNGNLVKRNWSGYNASYIDITPYLRYGDAPNTIAIRVDAEAMEGWWYEGAGMYRHAWLVKRSPVHVETDGVHATPRQAAGAGKRWQLPVEVSLNNSGKQRATVTVETRLFDPAGKQVAMRSASASVAALGKAQVKLPLALDNPALWSLAQTNLYRLTTRVLQEGVAQDEVSLHTGFRSIRFDAAQGFFLNGVATKLQGVCIHQDHAGVGVAVPDAIWEFRLRRLKELGVNAIRFSHNAPAPEVLDLVDRMGFVVMDENRNFNPSPDYMQQLEWMVKRDRHHPGVVLWSVFNEEPVQASEIGYEMARRMTAAVKALDDTRPVTAAMNGGFLTPLNVSHAVDVVGANYQIRDYDLYHKAYPGKPFTSSEDTSAYMTRGEFSTVRDKNIVASYDDDAAEWGNTHRDAWQAIASRPYVAGGFVWTGFDYRGEPTPYVWPSVSSSFGIMDMAGFPKNAYYIHQVQWIKDRPLLYIAPHWNWAGREGQEIRVMVMANVERVALLLNGRLLGEQQVDPFRMNDFKVVYQPGRLEAIGYRGGKEVLRTAVETTGAPVALELLPDRAALKGDGRDAMPVTVRALDAQGRAVPLADAAVTFAVSGAGRSLGHGNGDPNSHEDEKGASRRLFNGLAQLIVQSDYASQGEISIVASAPGLSPASVRIAVQAVAMPAEVAVAPPPVTQVPDWRFPPDSAQRIDPNVKLASYDMNSWGWGSLPFKRVATPEARFYLYRASFTPRRSLSDGKGVLHFDRILGKAEIWLDGALIGTKSAAAAAPLAVTLPAGSGQRELNVLIEAAPGQASGMEGSVEVRPAL